MWSARSPSIAGWIVTSNVAGVVVPDSVPIMMFEFVDSSAGWPESVSCGPVAACSVTVFVTGPAVMRTSPNASADGDPKSGCVEPSHVVVSVTGGLMNASGASIVIVVVNVPAAVGEQVAVTFVVSVGGTTTELAGISEYGAPAGIVESIAVVLRVPWFARNTSSDDVWPVGTTPKSSAVGELVSVSVAPPPAPSSGIAFERSRGVAIRDEQRRVARADRARVERHGEYRRRHRGRAGRRRRLTAAMGRSRGSSSRARHRS